MLTYCDILKSFIVKKKKFKKKKILRKMSINVKLQDRYQETCLRQTNKLFPNDGLETEIFKIDKKNCIISYKMTYTKNEKM